LGTITADFAKTFPTKKVKLFPQTEGAFMELRSGGCDAVVFDSPATQYYVRTAGEGAVKIVGPLYDGQTYGFACPQGSKWREKISIALLKLVEEGKGGTYDRIYQKWFGGDSK
jgi:glutamine transport system substrate-binding protein